MRRSLPNIIVSLTRLQCVQKLSHHLYDIPLDQFDANLCFISATYARSVFREIPMFRFQKDTHTCFQAMIFLICFLWRMCVGREKGEDNFGQGAGAAHVRFVKHEMLRKNQK